MELNTIFDGLSITQTYTLIGSIIGISIAIAVTISVKICRNKTQINSNNVDDHSINNTTNNHYNVDDHSTNNTTNNQNNVDDHSCHTGTYNVPIIIINNNNYNIFNFNDVNKGINAIYNKSPRKNKANNLELLEKQVLLMLYSEKFNVEEIASVLNCSFQETKDILKKLHSKGFITHSHDKRSRWRVIYS